MNDAQSGLRLRQEAEKRAANLPPLMVAAERVAAVVAQGLHGRRQVGAGETFWEFRPYQAGDAAGRVDWRQSARSQRLYVRENEWEAAQSVWLWCDRSPSMAYRSHASVIEKADRAALLTMALAVLLVRGGEQVALLGEDERPASGRSVLERMAARLVSDQPNDTSLPPRVGLARHATVVIVSDLLAPYVEIDSLIRFFVGCGVSGYIVQVLDPAEHSFPFTGRVRFEGLEDEGGLTVGRSESLRPGYAIRFGDRQRRLADLSRTAGWHFTVHHTDSPVAPLLLALYGALSAQVLD